MLKGLLIALCFVLAVRASVVVLTPDNFDTIIDGSKPAFIEFYAPWCGHCKKLAPEYDQVGEVIQKFSDKVVVAKVDCDAHKDLCGRYDITGYPTLKWFPKGETKKGDAYNGGRTADDILSFISGKVGINAKIKKAPSAVVDLTDASFDKVVLDAKKNVLVEFYAPWCGHCKQLAPIYEKLGNVFAPESDVVIARIDADTHKVASNKHGITGFPTLKWFPKDNKAGVAYEQGRELKDFVEFINKNAGTSRDISGSLPATAGRIAALDEIAKDFAKASNKNALLSKAKSAVSSLTGEQEKDGKVYLRIFEKIVEKGETYITEEKERVQRLLTGGHAFGKKFDEFTKRKNILAAF